MEVHYAGVGAVAGAGAVYGCVAGGMLVATKAGAAARVVIISLMFMGIHYRGVQWEGGAVDGGSIIQETSI